MDDPMLWLVGGLALALVVAALVWVLRHRADGGSAAPHRGYAPPAVTDMGTRGRSGVVVGGSDVETDLPLDQTVPLSRLGGAGWRDGREAPVESSTDASAGAAGLWAEDAVDTPDPVGDHHVAVDTTGAPPIVDEEADRRRGGHW